MSKSTELKNTTNIVKDILTRCPDTRSSDDLLYIKVCERINAICINMPFKDVMLKRKSFELPAFESVRRSRQKIQALHPELAADADVEAQRILNEQTFRKFARGNE